MNIFCRTISLGLAAVCCIAGAAQDDAFDLSSQRSEVQFINPVPGHKVTDRWVVINPTPQSMVYTGNLITLSRGFNLKGVDKALKQDAAAFLPESSKGWKVKVIYGKASEKLGVEQKSGAYKLTMSPKSGIEICGYDERGAFYGLQTLRQIVEQGKANAIPGIVPGTIPCFDITDYPSLPHRGVVEGFYGEPWSHEVRLSLIDFYGRNKLNTYIYGPKDDPYHSSPNWRQPYPDNEAQQIKELVDACKRNHVDFVWAIHPGKDIRWNEADYDSLVSKFNMMYDLGVRSFSIFFDDIEGEGTNPVKQVELLNRLNKEFVQAKGDVNNLSMCPTDYSRMWANPTENGSLAIFGRTLDKDIEVMYTGDVVCSDLTEDTMNFFDNLVQRPGYYWWNFPVSDYCRNYILQGPSYGLDTTLTDNEVVALVSNPMEHGEASKLALYGVADYAWNIPAYNPIDSWERGLEVLMPEAASAYRTFAIHSADTETGYRRAESWETTTFPFDNYTPEQFAALKADFEAVAAAPAEIEAKSTNPLLLRELHPWLVEFAKLGQRGLRTLDLIKIYPSASPEEFWTAYAANIMTPEDQAAYTAHKSGTLKLQPFYYNNMNDMLAGFYTRVTGEAPKMYRPIGSYRNIHDNISALMLDGDLDTYYTSGSGQRDGDWIGLDLRTVRPVSIINIRQGRNDVDDVDFFDHAILEVSVDGKTWTPLTEPMVNQYVINWTGEPVDARYVRLRRLDSKRTNWAAVRSFEVNPATPESLGIEVVADNAAALARMFDGNPSSAYEVPARGASFTRPQGKETLTFLMGASPAMAIEQLDADGATITVTNLTSPYVTVNLRPDAATLRLSGKGSIYEVL